VTFGVAPATGLALVPLLEKVLLRETEFREYLPDARSGGELRARLAKLAGRVGAILTSPAFAVDVLNHQRDLARPPADYGLPAQLRTTWYSVARRASVIRRDAGYVVVFEGGELGVGATWPTVDWMLRQRVFSLEDAAARQTGVDRAELARDVERLARAGILAETEMR
jgi:hypothetical protein